jgi:hypothetical protein
MADKRAIKVETLDRLGASFQESRGITDKLTIEQMIELAKVPTASGDNLLVPFLENTLNRLTAADLEGLTILRPYVFSQFPLLSLELPNSLTKIDDYAFYNVGNRLEDDGVKYDGTTSDWASKITFQATISNPISGTTKTTMYFRNEQGEYYKIEDDLVIPSGIEKINAFAFYEFELPRNITIGSSIKEIENNAFQYCSNCITLTLNEGLVSIGVSAFRHCDAIQDLVIPNSVRSLSNGAFRDSNFLNEVRIGNGITYMATNVFSNCPNLTDIYIDAAEGSVSGAPWGAPNATVHWNTPLPSKEV